MADGPVPGSFKFGQLGSVDFKQWRVGIKRAEWRLRDWGGWAWSIPTDLSKPPFTVSHQFWADESEGNERTLAAIGQAVHALTPDAEVVTTLEDPAGALDRFDSEPEWWRSAYWLQLYILLQEHAFEEHLPQAAGRFLRRYPNGRVEVWVRGRAYGTRMHLVGKFGASFKMRGTYPRTVEEWQDTPFDAQWFARSNPSLPVTPVGIGLALAAPEVFGFAAHFRAGFVVFHFGSSQSLRQPHPASAEHWLREDVLHENTTGRTLPETLSADRAENGRPLVTMDAPTWFRFWDWYMSRLNLALEALSQPWRFVKEGNFQAVEHFKLLSSLLRIADLVQTLTTGLTQYARVYMTFDIADMLSAIRYPGQPTRQAEDFKRRFSLAYVKDAEQRLRVSGCPPEVFAGFQSLYDDTHASLQRGFAWAPPDPGVRGESERLQLLRWLRNSRHGFFLDREGVEKYLIRHDGNLTKRFGSWALIWWLDALADDGLGVGLERP